MTEGLIQAVVKINGFICKLNALHDVHTPYLAGTVVRTNAARGRQPVLQWHKYFDGVHADDLLIEEWAMKIKKSIDRNRTKDHFEPLTQYSAKYLAHLLEEIHI